MSRTGGADNHVYRNYISTLHTATFPSIRIHCSAVDVYICLSSFLSLIIYACTPIRAHTVAKHAFYISILHTETFPSIIVIEALPIRGCRLRKQNNVYGQE